MTTHAPGGRTHVRSWYERLTLFRAVRTIVVIATLLVLAGGVLVRLIEPHTFDSIGLALWWAVTTVTTVGYGDVVPVKPAGRMVASALMITGFASLSLITGVIASILVHKRTEAAAPATAAGVEQLDQRLAEIERLLKGQAE